MEESRTVKYLKGLINESGTKCISLFGPCQKCAKEVNVIYFESGDTEGTGGIVKGEDERPLFKCSECLEKDNGKISPTHTEVFSRVCGYLRPVSGYNPGKKAERAMRTNFAIKEEPNVL